MSTHMRVARHLVIGHQRQSLCGRDVTLELPRPHELAPRDVVRRERVDLVAWAAVTCGKCRQAMKADEPRGTYRA